MDPPKQHEAADRLGRMVARGEISADGARDTMAAIIEVAQANAPNAHPGGLRTRLHWSARDALHEERLALVRLAREQEQALAQVAEAAIRAGGDDLAVRRAVGAAAQQMRPLPDIALGDAALRLARWRVKHGR